MNTLLTKSFTEHKSFTYKPDDETEDDTPAYESNVPSVMPN